VATICHPCYHSGKEAHDLLNTLAQKIHFNILDSCNCQNRQQLIETFYDLYEESCYTWLQREHLATGNKTLTRNVEQAPSFFKYLLECAILSEGADESQLIEQYDLLSFVLAAELFFQVCYYSKQLIQDSNIEAYSVTMLIMNS
jgi:hypothetical protein